MAKLTLAMLLVCAAAASEVSAAPAGSESALKNALKSASVSDSSSVVGLPSGTRGADSDGREIQEGSILPIPTSALKNASGADIAKAAEKATEIQATAAAAALKAAVGSAVEPSAGTLTAKKAMEDAPAGSPERAAAEKMYMLSKTQDAAAAAAGTAAGTWQPPVSGSSPSSSASASALAGSESGGSSAPAAPKSAGSEATAPVTGTGKDGDLNYYKPLNGFAAGGAAAGAGPKKDDAKENESLGRWAKDDGHWVRLLICSTTHWFLYRAPPPASNPAFVSALPGHSPRVACSAVALHVRNSAAPPLLLPYSSFLLDPLLSPSFPPCSLRFAHAPLRARSARPEMALVRVGAGADGDGPGLLGSARA